jgi:prevent-host-death family protein
MKKMREWPLAEAKAKFSELVGFAEENGPQYVTKRGKRTVVMVPVDDWEKLNADPSDRDAISWLLAPEARIEDLQIPDRKSFKWRKGARVR